MVTRRHILAVAAFIAGMIVICFPGIQRQHDIAPLPPITEPSQMTQIPEANPEANSEVTTTPTPTPTPTPLMSPSLRAPTTPVRIDNVKHRMAPNTAVASAEKNNTDAERRPPPFEATFESLHDVCKRVEVDFFDNIKNHCAAAQGFHATAVDKSAAGDFRVIGASSEGNTLVAFTITTVTATGATKSSGGDTWKLQVSGYNEERVLFQSAGRIVDNFDGTYGAYFEVRSDGGFYNVRLLYDFSSCNGYRLKRENANFVGQFALSFDIHSVGGSVTEDKGGIEVPLAEIAAPAVVAKLLAETGHYESITWHPPTLDCSYARPDLSPRLPRNVVFAGDSTTGQIGRCFYELLDERELGTLEQPTGDLCRQAHWARKRLEKNPALGNYPRLTAWSEIIQKTYLHCATSTSTEWTIEPEVRKSQDWCDVNIMGKNPNPAWFTVKSILKHFLGLKPSPHTFDLASTLVISVSAHYMDTYEPREFEAMVIDAQQQVGAYKGESQVVWRENWAMHEEVIQPSEYSARAPADLEQKFLGKNGPRRLTDAQAQLHRSLVLSRLNWATQGKVTISPSYWASKAWIKTLPKENLGCYLPALGCSAAPETFGEDAADDFDMRHMRPWIQIASIESLLDLFS
jgi:hypothetical protein